MAIQIKVATEEVCKNCGSNLILPDGTGGRYCFICTQPYTDWQDYGRKGRVTTKERYGIKHFVDLGKKGGRARTKTLADLRQQLAPKVQLQIKGGRLPNRLDELKELFAAKVKEGEARVSC